MEVILKARLFVPLILLTFLITLPPNVFAYATEYFYSLKGVKNKEGHLPSISEKLEEIDQYLLFSMPRRRDAEKNYGKVMIEAMDSFYGAITLSPRGSKGPNDYHNFEINLIIHELKFINEKTGEEYPISTSRQSSMYYGRGEWTPLAIASEFDLHYRPEKGTNGKSSHYPQPKDYTVYYRFPVPKDKHKNLIFKYHVSLRNVDGTVWEFKGKADLRLEYDRPSIFDMIP
jgi:hypothetical protein